MEAKTKLGCSLPPRGEFTYQDDYGIVYEISWDTSLSGLDITTTIKDPRVPHQERQGHRQGNILLLRGLISIQRQILVSTADGYTIISEGNVQEVGFFQSNFPSGPTPIDPFCYHLNNYVSDEIEFEVEIGSHWTDPDDATSDDVTWGDLVIASDGTVSGVVATSPETFEWIDVWGLDNSDVVNPPTISANQNSGVYFNTTSITFTGTNFIGISVVLHDSNGNVIPNTLQSNTQISATVTISAPTIPVGGIYAKVTNIGGNSGFVKIATRSNLVARWLFNEGSGLIANDSVDDLNLTSDGNSVWDADTPGDQAGDGGCILFLTNGIFSNLSSLGSLPLGGAPRSVSFWNKLTGTVASIQFYYGNVDFGIAASFRRTTSADLVFAETGSTGNSADNGTPAAAGWHLYTFTTNGTNWKFYVDGMLDSSGAFVNPPLNTDGSVSQILVAGQLFPASTARVKDLRAYSNELSDSDVLSLYNGTFDS